MQDADLIERVTPQAVAGWFGLTEQAVSNWKRRGIPLGKRVRFMALASERGIDVPPDFLAAPAVRAAAQ